MVVSKVILRSKKGVFLVIFSENHEIMMKIFFFEY